MLKKIISTLCLFYFTIIIFLAQVKVDDKTSNNFYNNLFENIESKSDQTIIEQDLNKLNGVQKQLTIFYKAFFYFLSKNYKDSQKILETNNFLLEKIFIEKILLEIKQNSQNYNKENFIEIIKLFPKLLNDLDFINLSIIKIGEVTPYWKDLHKKLWLLGEIKSTELNLSKNFSNTNEDYLAHLKALYKKREFNYLIKQFPKIAKRFSKDKKNYSEFLYYYALTLRRKNKYISALNILDNPFIKNYDPAIRLKFNIYLKLKREELAHNYINLLKKNNNQKIINKLRLDFANHHYNKKEFKNSLSRYKKIDLNYLTKNQRERIYWNQFFGAIHTNSQTEIENYLQQAKKHKFSNSSLISSICFWELKQKYKLTSNKKENSCLPQYFLNYYGWESLRFGNVDFSKINSKIERKSNFTNDKLVIDFLKFYKIEDSAIVDKFLLFIFRQNKNEDNFRKIAFVFREAKRFHTLIRLAINNYSFKRVKNTSFFSDWIRAVYPLGYIDEVKKVSEKNKLDFLLVLSLIREESHFNTVVKSSAGALGLMQLMPATAKEVANLKKIPLQDEQITDITINLELGTYYLKSLLNKYDDIHFALAAYNGGPGNVHKWRKIPYQDLDYFVEYIPFPETKNYVKKVIKSYNIYKFLYADSN